MLFMEKKRHIEKRMKIEVKIDIYNSYEKTE